MTSTRDLALNKWKGILLELGVPPAALSGKHTACPLCGGTDRFRFTDFKGTGQYFCNQCGSGHGMDLALAWTGQPFKDVAAQIDKICGQVTEQPAPTHDVEKTRKRLKRIGAELLTVGDLDPVARYLGSRGVGDVGRDFLRYHPRLPYYDRGGRLLGTFPAMVAAMRRATGEIETFHVTYLTPTGEKADVPVVRKVTGHQGHFTGCAIPLSPIVPHIGIAEGIETALSVTALYGIPCWAAFSAHGLSTFEPPQGVAAVSIYADPDSNFIGQHAATTLARRLHQRHLSVHIAPFDLHGRDYNDLLIEQLQRERAHG